MEKLQNLFKALSDETRLKILVLLYHRKLCVCQLQGILQEPQPKISKHLAKLRDMGLVKDERQEQFIFYCLNEKTPLLKVVLEQVIANGEDYPSLKTYIAGLSKADTYILQEKNHSAVEKNDSIL